MRYLLALLLLTPLLILAQPNGPALADDQCGHFLEGTEVLAEDIVSAARQRCAINAPGVTVVDDLSLGGVVEDSEDGVTLFIIDADLIVGGTTFTQDIDFFFATFLGRLDLLGAQFEGSVRFEGTIFADTDFRGANFQKAPTFRTPRSEAQQIS